ncbi:MAG: hypothetical protein EXS15_00795 [Phycisphaerales bacterium]|nr:hypothetical protein [Phycisphaerales bacterium]
MTRARAITPILLSVVGMLCVACNTLPTQTQHPGVCGIGLVIWLRHPASSQYQYFTIDDGLFAYGAGRDALNLKTSWQIQLSSEQCAAVCKIAADGQWLSKSPPTGSGAERQVTADIAVVWGGGQQQFVVVGDNESVREMTDILSAIADARFQRMLDRFPEAGKQPQ